MKFFLIQKPGKFILVIILLVICLNSIAQPDAIKKPAPGPINISIGKINIPKDLQKYAGIRFVDVRYLKKSAGFIPTFDGKNFLSMETAFSFEDQLNNSSNKNFKATLPDSIIVVIKNLWVNQIKDVEIKTYCHFSALIFIRRKDSVFFDAKIDSFFIHKIPARQIYKTIISNSVEDLLLSYLESEKSIDKRYTDEEFYKNLQYRRPAPEFKSDSSGIFLSHSDFIKGRLFKTEFFIDPIFDQFYYRISDEKIRTTIQDNLWGIMHNGELYIRNGRLLSRALHFENTYFAQSNLEIDGASYGYYAPYSGGPSSARDAATHFGAVALIELLRRKKAKIRSFPMILNIETGKLE